MPFDFKPSQLVLQDMATAEPGTIGWIVGSRQESAKLIMKVTRQMTGPPECLYVELSGENKFLMSRIGNIANDVHFMIKVPNEPCFELNDEFGTAGGLGRLGSLILATTGTYLAVRYASNFSGWSTHFVRLSDYVVDNDYVDGMKAVLGNWRMVAGKGSEKIVLVDAMDD